MNWRINNDTPRIDRWNQNQRDVEHVQPRYGSEAELASLGSAYTAKVDNFINSRSFEADVEDRIRQRIIGALLNLQDRNLLNPDVRISTEADRNKPDGIAVIVECSKSVVQSTQPPASSSVTYASESLADDPVWLGFYDPPGHHRPAWKVQGDPEAPLEHYTEADGDELGISAASSGSGAGFSQGQGRNSERQKDDDPDEQEDTLLGKLKRGFDGAKRFLLGD